MKATQDKRWDLNEFQEDCKKLMKVAYTVTIDVRKVSPPLEIPQGILPEINAMICKINNLHQMGDDGAEYPPESPVKTVLPELSGAEIGALDAQTPLIDPDLQALVDAWPILAESTKADILGLVRKSESA